MEITSRLKNSKRCSKTPPVDATSHLISNLRCAAGQRPAHKRSIHARQSGSVGCLFETACRWVPVIFWILLAVTLTGCLKPGPKDGSLEGQGSAAAAGAIKESPRVTAALQLTDQGRRLLEDHQPDKAIRVLEQAVSLNPLNGQNYYYLAEAWLMKGSAAQATEFNQLAEIHLKEDPQWMMRVAQQADQIAQLDN